MSYPRRTSARSAPYKKRTYKRKAPMHHRSAGSMVVPGYTRTGGFYGRYNKSSTAGQAVEVKFLDTEISDQISLTGEVPPTGGQVALVPQGTTQSSRDGRKCTIKSILFRGTFVFAPGADANAATDIFMWLVMDKQCNGAAAAVTDVFTSTAMNTALHNLSNSERFLVLKKFKMQFNAGAGSTTAYSNVTKHYEFYKKCNIPMEFSSTTGAITEIKSNNIFWIWGCDSLDDQVTCTATTRVRFVG